MAGGTDAPHPRNFAQRWVWLMVAALLALYAGVALTASMEKGVSFDEGEELAVGYDIWLHHDFRMEGANGDFVKRWATLPLLISRPAFPAMDSPSWRLAEPYALGFRFFFEDGNDPAALLLQGRAMMVLLGIATGLLVFYGSREIFGPVGGLVSLALFVFSPDMLAYGGIVSTEMSICLAMLGSTWCVWRLLHRVTWGRLLASLGFLAFLFLAKPTALVIFPITAILLAVKIFSKRPLEWNLGRRRMISSRAAQAGIFCALFVVHGLFCWACLWAHYDFRYSASPDPANPAIQAWVRTPKNSMTPSMGNFLSWSRETHFFAEGYLDGIERLLTDNEARASFRDGQWTIGGSRAFFPYTIWAKTSPVLFLFLLLGTAWWWARRRGPPAAQNKSGPIPENISPPSFYGAIPYVTLAVVFLAVAIAQDLNIAHRHILPIYPALDILAGGAIGFLWARRQRWMTAVAALLLLGYAGDALTLYPNYLAYFSPVVGGDAQGYKRLVDSSLDWGMDLPGLKTWLGRHNPDNREPLYLSYFGTDNPDYYGIISTRLPSYPAWEARGVYDLNPGLYAISATIFESLYTETRGSWNKVFETKYQKCLRDLRVFNDAAKDPAQLATLLKNRTYASWIKEYDEFAGLRFARLCAWLRHNHPPDDNVAHAILIWKLNRTEIDAALYGPPAELTDTPLGNPTPEQKFADKAE